MSFIGSVVLAQVLRTLEWSSLIPILGMIVGGLMAVLGSLVHHRITERKERRLLVREKLEELYFISDEVEAHVLETVRWITMLQLGMKSDEDEKVARDTSTLRLVMIARIYERNLVPLAEELKQYADQVGKNAREVFLKMASDQKTLPHDEIAEAIQPLGEVQRVAPLLRSEIERISQKYL